MHPAVRHGGLQLHPLQCRIPITEIHAPTAATMLGKVATALDSVDADLHSVSIHHYYWLDGVCVCQVLQGPSSAHGQCIPALRPKLVIPFAPTDYLVKRPERPDGCSGATRHPVLPSIESPPSWTSRNLPKVLAGSLAPGMSVIGARRVAISDRRSHSVARTTYYE